MIAIIILMLLFPLTLHGAITSDECLGCHDKYKEYKHGKAACVDCHSSISSIPHEEKLEKPSCNKCHNETAGRYSKSIHSKKNIACKDCHNTHFITAGRGTCVSCHSSVSHASLPSKEKHSGHLECLACHGEIQQSNISVEVKVKKGFGIKRGEIDLDGNNVIDRAEWDSLQGLLTKNKYAIHKKYTITSDVHSVKGKHVSCDDCHTGKAQFSNASLIISEKASSYNIPMERRIFISKLPSRETFKKTVHGKKGVSCIDCHISQKQIDDSVCISCHEELYGVYKGTSHAKKGAVRCTDCHNPHGLTPYKGLDSRERIAVCSRCHKDYLAKHSWLPNTLLHFNYLECSTCHSPGSTKSMVFYLKTKEGNKKLELTYNDIEKALGDKKEIESIIDRDGDGVISYKELTGFFTGLSEKLQKDIFLDSSIVVTKVYHTYSEKSRKQKVCASCHSENAPFYESMYLAIPGKDGHTYIPVKRTILSALPTSLFIDICLLGEKKIKVKDFKEFFKTTQGGKGDINFSKQHRGGKEISSMSSGLSCLTSSGFWFQQQYWPASSFM
ncbi:MAG: ammonia-forming cytochrome c nitrite reductase subunit c552 [Proteobacteria bacterium]|nr:ammonia-forming cytochrome c nitrite reductase subunit c552 [Pseudomonadota bacterium]